MTFGQCTNPLRNQSFLRVNVTSFELFSQIDKPKLGFGKIAKHNDQTKNLCEFGDLEGNDHDPKLAKGGIVHYSPFFSTLGHFQVISCMAPCLMYYRGKNYLLCI